MGEACNPLKQYDTNILRLQKLSKSKHKLLCTLNETGIWGSYLTEHDKMINGISWEREEQEIKKWKFVLNS